MDLRTFGRAIRKFWWVVLLTVILSTGAAVGLTSREAPQYASTVTFFVSTSSNAVNGNSLQQDQAAQLKVNSFVELLTSQGLAKLIVDQPGVGLTEGQVSHRITASAPANTVLLTATVTDTSKARSLAVATAIANTFPGMVRGLDPTPSKPTTVLHVVAGPQLHSAPVSPHKTLNYGLGFLIGLAIGLTIAFLRELLDTSMRTPEAVEGVAGAAVLGSIGFEKQARKAPLIVDNQVRSIRAEAFRALRTNLQFVDVDNPIGVIVVTSSVAAEGKSTTAANLAIVFAESGQRVLLIEADLRRPRVTDYMGLERAVGVSNVLAGQVSIDEVLQPWGSGGLTVLPSGSIPPNPSELLGSQNMRDLVAGLRHRFDMIIIDTPPLLPVTDAAVAASLADGVVVVVRHGKTSRVQLSTTIKSLKSVDARLLGVVVNMRPSKGDIQGRYDGYGYHEDSPERNRPRAVQDGGRNAAATESRRQRRLRKRDRGSDPVDELDDVTPADDRTSAVSSFLRD